MTSRLALALLMAVATPALAQVSPDETDPRKIMDAVEGRETGDKVKSRMVMTITDGAGRERTRTVQSRGLEFEGGSRRLMVFEEPAEVKGTGMLSVDYDDGDKDDDQWLYLPSLHKSTRISSGDRSGSFMGTAFSYADMTRPDPKHWDYVIQKQSVSVDGDDCWLIEATPKTKKAKKETGYLKTQMVISKSKLQPLRIKAWVKKGKKIKQIAFEDLKQVNGLWIPHTLKAVIKKGKKVDLSTVLQFTEMSFDNADITADMFTQRQLEKGL